MEAKHTQMFIKESPRKLRLVADMIKSLSPMQAIETLPFVRKKAATSLGKAIKTAVANARDKGMSDEGLKFKSLQITEGPRLKRFRPVSRGRAHGYVRRMSHIKIILEDQKKQETKSK